MKNTLLHGRRERKSHTAKSLAKPSHTATSKICSTWLITSKKLGRLQHVVLVSETVTVLFNWWVVVDALLSYLSCSVCYLSVACVYVSLQSFYVIWFFTLERRHTAAKTKRDADLSELKILGEAKILNCKQKSERNRNARHCTLHTIFFKSAQVAESQYSNSCWNNNPQRLALA